MKGAQLAVNILLFILVGVLFYFHFSNKNEMENTTLEESYTEDSKNEKNFQVRYVNTDSIWSKYDYVEQLRADLDRKQKQYEDEMERKIQEFQSKVQEFQQNMMTLSREEGQQKQQELMLQEQKLQQMQEEYNLKLVEEEEKMRNALRERITSHLVKLKGDEIELILDNSASSGVLLFPDSLDITSDVLRSLNDTVLKKPVDK